MGGWEILVINNNSTDATPEVCEEFAGKLPLHYHVEKRQGKSYALNTAISLAKGEVLLFTDDDVTVPPEWVQCYLDAAQTRPEASFFGGKIIPEWDQPPPKWLEEHHDLVDGITVSYSRGDTPCIVSDNQKPFFGANFAIRKEALDCSGIRFQTDLGLIGSQRIGGEEQVLIAELIEKGHLGYYMPEAFVYHWTSPDRMTEKYIWKWYASYGRLEAKLGQIPCTNLWFRVPRYLWRELLVNICFYLITRFLGTPQRWLRHEKQAAFAWGAISEIRNHSK